MFENELMIIICILLQIMSYYYDDYDSYSDQQVECRCRKYKKRNCYSNNHKCLCNENHYSQYCMAKQHLCTCTKNTKHCIRYSEHVCICREVYNQKCRFMEKIFNRYYKDSHEYKICTCSESLRNNGVIQCVNSIHNCVCNINYKKCKYRVKKDHYCICKPNDTYKCKSVRNHKCVKKLLSRQCCRCDKCRK